MEFPKFGFGAKVVDDPSLPWTRSEDFRELLDLCRDELKIDYLDSARGYGRSEELIGKWVQAQKPEVLSKTVIGSKVHYDQGNEKPVEYLSSDFVLASAKESKEKLCVPIMDVYWLHGPDPAPVWQETIEGFHRVVEEKAAKQYGLSNVTLEQIEEIQAICEKSQFIKPKFIQNQFNILCANEQIEVIRKCQKDHMKFVAYSPLAGGILTGKYSFDGDLPKNTRWESWKQTIGLPDFWTKENFKRIEQAKIIADNHQVDFATIFLKWASSFEGVDTILFGPRNKNQIQCIRDLHKLDSRSVVNELNELFGFSGSS